MYGADRVVCVERDRDMIEHLKGKLPEIAVHYGDATQFAWDTILSPDEPAVICGNLPYNVSSVIYFDLLLQHRHRFRRMVLMFQRELADRFLGRSRRHFGPPSILTEILAEARMILTVKPRSFRPPPKVDSAVLKIEPREAPLYTISPDDIEAFSGFVHTLFAQRRKTIRNNLKAVAGDRSTALLHEAGIHETTRAEAVPVESLVKLWRCVIGESHEEPQP
jgi:16S rRNA (adenine1518-N6/adenine1519-N6)-dimethyltransferase